jgi:hypothetical protein
VKQGTPAASGAGGERRRPDMTRSRSRAVVRLLAGAAVVVIGIGWAMPLSWATLAATAVALLALTVAALRRPLEGVSTAAACCVTGIGGISLAYAAYALAGAGPLRSLTRLGYPFLVATGLRVGGGICVLLLCGLVALVPLFFAGDSVNSSK